MNFEGTAELVRAAQAGAPGALDQLVDAWLPEVLAWCMRLAPPTVQPEDAAQDAMESMIDGLDALRDPTAFPAWLYQITRRVLKRHGRRAWVRKWMPGADVPDNADDGEPLVVVGQTQATTDRAVGPIALLQPLVDDGRAHLAAVLGLVERPAGAHRVEHHQQDVRPCRPHERARSFPPYDSVSRAVCEAGDRLREGDRGRHVDPPFARVALHRRDRAAPRCRTRSQRAGNGAPLPGRALRGTRRRGRHLRRVELNPAEPLQPLE